MVDSQIRKSHKILGMRMHQKVLLLLLLLLLHLVFLLLLLSLTNLLLLWESADVISVFLNDIQNEAFEPNTPPYLQPKDNFFRKLLPLQIVSDRGAIIIGNSNLPTILVAEFKRVEGTYEACRVSVSFRIVVLENTFSLTTYPNSFSRDLISTTTRLHYHSIFRNLKSR